MSSNPYGVARWWKTGSQARTPQMGILSGSLRKPLLIPSSQQGWCGYRSGHKAENDLTAPARNSRRIGVDHIEELINDTLTGYEVCRCMLGVAHDEGGMTVRDYENEQNEDGYGKAISAYDAVDLWTSSGGDEDYSFGYFKRRA